MRTAGGALRAAFLMAVILVSAGCSQVINYPVPTVTSLSPDNAQAGGANFTLTVKGKDFVFGGAVIWNGSPMTTLFVSGGELQATINPANITVPATIEVQVFNPPPGGGFSNKVDFTIKPVTSPVPTITSLKPTGTAVGGTGLSLDVLGSNFVANSVVTWNGQNLVTSYLSADEIRGAVTGTLLETPGTAAVAVLNPPPGGGLSLTVPFNVNNPSPTITSMSPNTAIVGAPDFTLTIQGGGYTCADYTTTTDSNNVTTSICSTPSSVVAWNGTPLPTTYVSSTQITATVPTAQLAQAGTVFVTIVNPAPGGGVSSEAYFQVIPGQNGEGLPMLVDVSSNGDQADSGIGNPGLSGPAIGGGGRVIAFSSISQNLVDNLANEVANVFVRDTCLGIATGCLPQTLLASVGNNGQPPNADCLEPSISSDGRYLVYASKATNLVSNITTSGNTQIFLVDTCLGASSGCAQSTTLLTVAQDGVSPANGSNTEPYISPDARYVAFVSTATNLTAQAPTGAPEVYVRTTCLNAASPCTPATTMVSLAPDGSTPANGQSATPVVASGGRYVAFQSTATNLVATPTTSGTRQLYWRDTCIGVSTGCTPATSLVSIDSSAASPGNGPSVEPALSSDGRYVVFSSQATNLIGAGFVSGTPQQVYERDMCAGASGCTPATSLLSVATDGSSPANTFSDHPVTDQSGRYVLFGSKASNLISTPTNGFEQIFARDTCVGATSSCTPRTVIVSVAGIGGSIGNGDSLYPAITTQSHFAAFLSFSDNLVNDDTTPTLEDIFLAATSF